MEFHISGKARKLYDFSEKLFSYNGNVIFADIRAVREFTAKINAVRVKEGRPQTYAGEINALGLLDEITHALLDQYRKRYAPEMKTEAYDRLKETLGELVSRTDALLLIKREKYRNDDGQGGGPHSRQIAQVDGKRFAADLFRRVFSADEVDSVTEHVRCDSQIAAERFENCRIVPDPAPQGAGQFRNRFGRPAEMPDQAFFGFHRAASFCDGAAGSAAAADRSYLIGSSENGKNPVSFSPQERADGVSFFLSSLVFFIRYG